MSVSEDNETELTILQRQVLHQQQKLVENHVNTQNMQQVVRDANFEEESWKNINERDSVYTGLINHYTYITKLRNCLKEIHKWLYFWIIMFLMIFFSRYVFNLLKSMDLSQENSVKNLVMLVTALISFSSVVISIPLIITKYLFSSEEDKCVTDIILHTQNYDSSGRQWALNLKKTATSDDLNNGLEGEVKPPI